MEDRPDSRALTDVVSDRNVAQLLARASELDAVRNSGAKVAELRTAAIEAGISGESFDAALAEMRSAASPDPAQVAAMARAAHARRQRWVPRIIAGLMLLVLIMMGGLLAVRSARRHPTQLADAPLVDDAILLRCVSAREAAELVRPLMHYSENFVRVSRRAPHVLNVHATAAQLQEVHALLDKYENDPAAACAVPPAR